MTSSNANDTASNPVPSHVDQHPALQKISITNCDSVEEIIPNYGPFPIDNECFTGQVMLLIRTPDVDDRKQGPPPGETAQRVSKYMKGKKRRFEFHFQVKLKKIPTGPLFLGGEAVEPVKVTKFTKGLANILLKMVRRINPGFHYSWGVSPDTVDANDWESGNYEATHLSFPLEASMDRIVISKPGETPPQIGMPLEETNQSVKRRRKMGSGSVEWNLEDTYTMCLWNAYCDWLQWKSMNVPGCRPFSLNVVAASQPIYLSVYELTDCTAQEYKKKRPPHLRQNLSVYTRLEFAHQQNTTPGMAPRFQGVVQKDETDMNTNDGVTDTGSDDSSSDTIGAVENGDVGGELGAAASAAATVPPAPSQPGDEEETGEE